MITNTTNTTNPPIEIPIMAPVERRYELGADVTIFTVTLGA
jgi:hypothetical protein